MYGLQQSELKVQTVSSLSADKLLSEWAHLGLSNFKNSEATANFCRIINDIFYILNTRNSLSHSPWRKPFNKKKMKLKLNDILKRLKVILSL
jgi:hypothetical protein